MEEKQTLAELEALYKGQLQYIKDLNAAIANIDNLRADKVAVEANLSETLAKLTAMYDEQKADLTRQLEEVTA